MKTRAPDGSSTSAPLQAPRSSLPASVASPAKPASPHVKPDALDASTKAAPALVHRAPRHDAPHTIARGPIAIRQTQEAFSRPPQDLTLLLAVEIRKACEFVNAMKTAFTFFGGAKIEKTDPLFAAGERWGEALFLANLVAEAPEIASRAIASELFSPEAVKASRAAILGVAAGYHGPAEIGRALMAVGGASSPEALARALTTLQAKLVEKDEVKLLLGLAPRPRTGAGPGMMDAVPLGYVAARQRILEAFPDLPEALLGDLKTEGAVMGKLASEEKKSISIDQKEIFLHFVSRRLALMEGAAGLVVFPGGIGTLNEVFEAARDGIPLVFDGKEFWGEALDVLTTKWRERDLVPESERAFFDLVEGVEEGLPYLLDAKNQKKPIDPDLLVRRGVEMAKELEHGLETLAAIPTAVTILGGHRLRANDAEVKEAKALVEHLTYEGAAIRVGGDGALYDAVVEGVKAAGRAPKDTLQALVLDRGDTDLAKIAATTKHAEVVHSAIVHKLLMYENTEAIVALPGGKGTFDEVFEVACLMVTGNLPERPLVLVGREFWQPFLDACEKVMDRADRPVVVPQAFRKLFQVVDTAAEAEAIVRAHRNRAG